MKVLVPVKRVLDPYVKVRVKSDHSGVDLSNAKMAMNPFDEIALEEAIRLKEKGVATEVVVVSIGATVCQETLRAGLALGADRAIHIATEVELNPLKVAKVLKVLVEQENFTLVLLGKQSIDGDNNQTGQMLAALLDWPQGTFASKVDVSSNALTVIREVDGGLETLELQLPAIVTTDLRLNVPRYASLPNIMKAKQKPLKSITLEELGVEKSPHTEVEKIEPPPVRTEGIMVESVDMLLDKLKNEARVIS